jgi:hypothetical protein
MALDPEGAAQFVGDVKPLIEQAMSSGAGPRAAVDAFFDYVCPGLWGSISEAAKEPCRANHVELFGDLQMPPYKISTQDLDTFRVPCRIIRGDSSHPILRHVAEHPGCTHPRRRSA